VESDGRTVDIVEFHMKLVVSRTSTMILVLEFFDSVVSIRFLGEPKIRSNRICLLQLL